MADIVYHAFWQRESVAQGAPQRNQAHKGHGPQGLYPEEASEPWQNPQSGSGSLSISNGAMHLAPKHKASVRLPSH